MEVAVAPTKEAENVEKADPVVCHQSQRSYVCALCDVVCTGPVGYAAHVKSEKHQKVHSDHREGLKNTNKGTAAEKAAKAVVSNKYRKSYRCELCNVVCNAAVVYENHLKGSKHRRVKFKAEKRKFKAEKIAEKAEKKAAKKAANEAAIAAAEKGDTVACRQLQKSYICVTCDAVCSGPVCYASHIKGAKHQKAVQRKTSLGKPIPTDPKVLNSGKEKILNKDVQPDQLLQECNIENIDKATKIKEMIIDCLGMEFIQNFVEWINPNKFSLSMETRIFYRIDEAAKKMNMKESEIDFDVDPISKNFPDIRHPQYVCNFNIRKCFLATGMDKRKQDAKMNAALGGINTLIKLVNEFNNDSERFLPIPEEDVKNLEILRKNIGNVIPTNKYSDETMKKFQLQKYILFERYLIRAPDNNNVWRSNVNLCKILYKNILLSSGCHNSLNKAKVVALKSAFNKLKNLSNCEIKNNEIVEHCQTRKRRFSNISSLSSNPGCSEEVKTKKIHRVSALFTLNKSLFDSSTQDSFVIMDILDNNSLKSAKEILSQSTSFCKKTFTFNCVKIGASPPLLYRADLLIDGVAVGSGTDCEQEIAKMKACEIAFEMLREKYYVIQMNCEFKRSIFSQSSYSVGMEDIMYNIEEELGFMKQGEDTNDFKRKIDSILKHFSESDSLNNLIFAYNKHFNMAESKDIEMVAEKYNLHTTNLDLGNDELMTLVVRRKYSIEELLNYLVNVGGSDIKYKLVDATISMQDPFKKIKKPFKTSLWTKKK